MNRDVSQHVCLHSKYLEIRSYLVLLIWGHTFRHHFVNIGPYSQNYGFSSSHVWLWELDHKEGWTPKNWCFRIVVLEKTLESPWNCNEIKPVNPEGNQLWLFTGRTDAEAGVQYFWPPDVNDRLTGKDRLRAGGKGGNRGWGWWGGVPDSMDMSLSKLWRQWRTGKPGMLPSMGSQRVGYDLATEQQHESCNFFPFENYAVTESSGLLFPIPGLINYWNSKDLNRSCFCQLSGLQETTQST